MINGMERIQAITNAVSTTAMTTDSASVRRTTLWSNSNLLGICCPGSSWEDEPDPPLKIVSLKEVLDTGALRA